MCGYCNLGEWNLKLFQLRKLIGLADFLKDAIAPDQVARVVRNEIYEGSLVDQKDSLRSWVTGIAKYSIWFLTIVCHLVVQWIALMFVD